MKHIMEHIASSERAAHYARKRRRSYAIHFYSGKNGSSKSLTAIYDTLPDLSMGTPVLSTVRLLDYENPRPCDDADCTDLMHGRPDHLAAHPCYRPFTDWHQLMEWSDGPVLMDEITGVADSNESQAMPQVAANKLAQLRRDDCVVRITGLNFVRANKRIREAVTAVSRCRGSWSTVHENADGSERQWRRTRFSVVNTYDAQTLPLDDHSAAAYEKAQKIVTARHWIPSSPAIHAYDTLAPVLMVGHVSTAGRCVVCDGNRRVPECRCTDYLAAKPPRSGAAARKGEARHGGTGAGDLVSGGLALDSGSRSLSLSEAGR